MDKILATDCYLPVGEISICKQILDKTILTISDDYSRIGKVRKHTGMIVLTKEQYLENIKDAMNYGSTPSEYLEYIETLLK